MPTALVTGATGFVGSHLVDHLLEKGYRVSCTVRKTSSLKWLDGKSIARVEADLRKPVTLPEADTVFHVAGVLRADTYEEYRAGNWLASKHVVEAARCGRLVHVSSLAVAGPGRVTEESVCAPVSMYGKSKLEGEQEVWDHRARVPVTVIRPPVVYGERDPGLYDMYRSLSMGVKPEIGGRKEISIVHVRDLVEGAVRAAESSAGADQVFYLSNPEAHAVSDLMDLILRALGKKRLATVTVPDRVVRFLGAVAEETTRMIGRPSMFNRDKAMEMTQPAWICSPAKAKRLLDWEARVPLEEGMHRTIAWYRAEGML